MDRFDEMRAKKAKPKLQIKTATPTKNNVAITPDIGYNGLSKVTVEGDSNLVSSNIKKNVSIFGVTGTLESGGGSSNFNVYMQNNEPSSKNGVWIKKSGNSSNKVSFSPRIAKKGTFLDGNFTYMNQNAEIRGQVIVGKYMYVFGASSSTSYRYDLENNIITSINAPTYSNYSSVEMNNAIYCEKRNSIYLGYITANVNYKNYFRIWEYDIATNTWSQMYEIEGAHSSARFLYMHLYDDKLCVYEYNSSYGSDRKKISIDIDTKERTNTTNCVFPHLNYIYSYFCVGKYFYQINQFNGLLSTLANIQIEKYDVSANTLEETKTFSNIFKTYLASSNSPTSYIVVLGDKVYIFFYSNSNRRLIGGRFDWNTGDGEVILSDIYMPSSMYYTSKYWQALIPTITTDRVYWHYPNFDTWAFQIADDNIEDLSNGTALIIQDLSGLHTTTIEDSSKLTIGIKNAYVVNNGELDEYATFYGDSEEWILLKNPNNETAIVTFDGNGGTTIPPTEVVLGQRLILTDTPSKTGYVFDDWYLNGKPFDFSTPITEDITLVAQWTTYEVLEYIEGVGTQYVDTGFKPNQDTKAEMTVIFTSVTTDGTSQDCLWCARGASNINSFVMFRLQTSFRSDYNTTLQPISDITVEANKSYTLCMDKNKVYVDNELVHTFDEATFAPSTNMTIFASNVAGQGLANYGKYKMYSCKIWDNDVLVRDFVPIKTAKGVVGLLDLVENKGYYNAGTGAFIAGEVVQ